MSIKHINIFQSKALQNLPKLGFLVLKQTIWQPGAANEIKKKKGSHQKPFLAISHRNETLFFSAQDVTNALKP
jgi:hypothetical protein